MTRQTPFMAASYAAARISAAPFSAIIMVGALVLPDVIAGITEASTTRSRSTPGDAEVAVDHHHRVAGQPHFGGAHRMKDRGADIARGLDKRRLVIIWNATRPADIRRDDTARAPAARRCGG